MEVSTTKIEKLLQQYFEGKTSLVEENELKKYFNQKHVASHLESYRPMFQLFNSTDEVEEEFVFQFPEQESTSSKGIKLKKLLVAASFALVVSLSGIFYHYYEQQQLAAAELAFMQTKEALFKVSSEFNTGIQNLEHLQELDKTTPFFNPNNK